MGEVLWERAEKALLVVGMAVRDVYIIQFVDDPDDDAPHPGQPSFFAASQLSLPMVEQLLDRIAFIGDLAGQRGANKRSHSDEQSSASRKTAGQVGEPAKSKGDQTTAQVAKAAKAAKASAGSSMSSAAITLPL